jgi:hypothetical protein
MALAVTLFVHLALILLLPERFILVDGEGRQPADAAEDTIYEINLVDPATLRYVEANPEVPENEPDRSDQYSYRSQQAADESPLSDAMNQPQVDGTEASQKIIQGSIEQSPPIEPGLYAPERRPGEGEGTEGGPRAESAEAVVPPVAQAVPPPDFLDQAPVDEVGPGSRVDARGEALEISPEPEPNAPVNVYRAPPSEGVAEVEQAGNGGGPEVKPQPRARPRLAPELITGPLMRSEGSASRRGSLAIDATFSEFGEYEQQFYAAIQTGWYQEIEFFQPIDTSTRVHVRFTLTASGEVLDLETVQSNASEIARVICESAINKRSPFRPWTREMVAVFGESRTLNVVFHYR